MTERTTTPTVRFARDLREIGNLSAALTTQAIHKATDRLMPGGLAMVSLAPVASPSTYDRQVSDLTTEALALAIEFDLDPTEVLPEVDDDTWHTPLQLLRTWTDPLRRLHARDYPERPPTNQTPSRDRTWLVRTIETEAKFLTWVLTDGNLASDPDFTKIAADTNKARNTLEVILYAGRRAERTRVICDRETCTKHPPLIRVRATRQVAGWQCRDCGTEIPLDDEPTHCPNQWCWSAAPPIPTWISNPADDRYKCTACKTWFDHDAYRRAHAKQLHSTGAERYVRLADAISTLKAQGRSAETVRNWLRPIEHIADRCTLCGAKQAPDEYPACPQYVIDKHTKQHLLDDDGNEIECGGMFTRIWSGDLDDIVDGFCDLTTTDRLVWWPDLWRRHLKTRTRTRKAA